MRGWVYINKTASDTYVAAGFKARQHRGVFYVKAWVGDLSSAWWSCNSTTTSYEDFLRNALNYVKRRGLSSVMVALRLGGARAVEDLCRTV